jgi:predicted permease
VTGRGEPEEVRTWRATPSVLTTLGVQPGLGRWLTAADATPGVPDVVMLSDAYWRRMFGGSSGVLGQTLTLNTRAHQIVGVLPQRFRFHDEFDVILPLRIDRARPVPPFRLLGVARMKPGVSLAQANADSARILKLWLATGERQDPEFLARYQPGLVLLKEDVIGDVGGALWVLMGAIGIVLVMACANVATLLLVRTDARRQEFAIRAALGARWNRVARPLVVESLTIATLGGTLGLLVASGGIRVLHVLGPDDLPRLAEIAIDVQVFMFTVVISVFSGLLFGLFPVLRFAAPRLVDALGAGSRGGGVSRGSQRSQQTLVAAQVALALVLLVSAGLMIRSFQALRHVDPGFTDPGSIQTISVSIPPPAVAEPERVVHTQRDMLERIAAIPGVESAAFTTRLPMGGDRSSTALSVEGVTEDTSTPPNRQVKIVSPGTFRTLGTRVVAGRDFTWADIDDKRDIAMVSENLARTLWGSAPAALGKRFREYYGSREGPWYEVVGVAADMHDDGADRRAPETIYWPAQPRNRFQGMSGYQARKVSIAIRSDRVGTASLIEEVRRTIRSVNAAVPIADVRTLDQVFDTSLARTSFTLVMLAIAGAMALLLGLSGLYGVIAYAVSQRRREIGIRLALGAEAYDIRRLFVHRGLVLISAGLAIGLAGALGTTTLLQSLLFGVSPRDPVAFTAMPLVLAAAAMLASYLPARRASAVDPAESLRAE